MKENSCHANCCCKGKKGPESWVKHTNTYDLYISSHSPMTCMFPATFLAVTWPGNSGLEHLPCVWQELCSVYLFNRVSHSTLNPVQAWLYQTAGTRACLWITEIRGLEHLSYEDRLRKLFERHYLFDKPSCHSCHSPLIVNKASVPYSSNINSDLKQVHDELTMGKNAEFLLGLWSYAHCRGQMMTFPAKHEIWCRENIFNESEWTEWVHSTFELSYVSTAFLTSQ